MNANSSRDMQLLCKLAHYSKRCLFLKVCEWPNHVALLCDWFDPTAISGYVIGFIMCSALYLVLP
jgi:hypothetical protein